MTPAEIAASLIEHELHPVSNKDGRTIWKCRTCDDFSVDAAVRHSIAQADHQAAFLVEVPA